MKIDYRWSSGFAAAECAALFLVGVIFQLILRLADDLRATVLCYEHAPMLGVTRTVCGIGDIVNLVWPAVALFVIYLLWASRTLNRVLSINAAICVITAIAAWAALATNNLQLHALFDFWRAQRNL
jgi:hypothetical protein